MVVRSDTDSQLIGRVSESRRGIYNVTTYSLTRVAIRYAYSQTDISKHHRAEFSGW